MGRGGDACSEREGIGSCEARAGVGAASLKAEATRRGGCLPTTHTPRPPIPLPPPLPPPLTPPPPPPTPPPPRYPSPLQLRACHASRSATTACHSLCLKRSANWRGVRPSCERGGGGGSGRDWGEGGWRGGATRREREREGWDGWGQRGRVVWRGVAGWDWEGWGVVRRVGMRRRARGGGSGRAGRWRAAAARAAGGGGGGGGGGIGRSGRRRRSVRVRVVSQQSEGFSRLADGISVVGAVTCGK